MRNQVNRLRTGQEVDDQQDYSEYTDFIDRSVCDLAESKIVLAISTGRNVEQARLRVYGQDSSATLVAMAVVDGVLVDEIVGPVACYEIMAKVLDVDDFEFKNCFHMKNNRNDDL
ncbi:hypothetical protein [Paraburkholderia sp. 32]|uniref:hypothetical protein n=1 Tax=Paraburkholderia sp. 32 TaxID=2991057 RepID=UPI003D1EB69F